MYKRQVRETEREREREREKQRERNRETETDRETERQRETETERGEKSREGLRWWGEEMFTTKRQEIFLEEISVECALTCYKSGIEIKLPRSKLTLLYWPQQPLGRPFPSNSFL